MDNTWVDVTAQLQSISHKLNFLQTVSHPTLDFEQTMHAHEINDPKIDPKWDINSNHTISKMIDENKIKLPEKLTIPQLKNIFAEIIKLQANVLQGGPLHQTIYTFTYLFSQRLWNSTIVIQALIESIHSLGAYVYQLHKTSCSLKQDDLSFSTFSFKNQVKSQDQVAQILLNAQKQIQNILKNEKDAHTLIEGKELISHIKLRRSLHLLVKVLGQAYDPKSQSKIETEIKAFRKRLSQLQTQVQKNQTKECIPEGVFNADLAKTIRCNFGWKPLTFLTLNQAFKELKNMIEQLQLFCPPPSKITEYRSKLDILSYKPIDLLSKSYLKVSFFKKENYLLSTIKAEDAIFNDIKEWMPVSSDLKQNQKFLNLLNLSGPTFLDAIYKHLGRNTRWFWQISKTYDDFNVFIHLCSQIDSASHNQKKDTFLSSWYYNFATTNMIRQVLWGFEEDLYEKTEYHYVAYYLEYLLHINQKNNNYFFNTIDRSILQSFYDGSLGKNKKKKKQLTDLQKKFLSDSIYLKGIHYYFRAFFRLLVILINRKFIIDPFADTLELRINNRFRVFKNVLFLKKLNFETFKKQVEIITNDQAKILDEATELLKVAKQIFGLFNQFDQSQTQYSQLQEASILEKLCVKLSLVAMTLKFKQQKKFSIRKQYKKFPEIHIQ